MSKTTLDIEDVNKQIKLVIDEKKENEVLILQKSNMPDPIKFVDQKIEQNKMNKDLKNWERKIEIAQIAAKKARTIIREHQREMGQFDMEGYE